MHLRPIAVKYNPANLGDIGLLIQNHMAHGTCLGGRGKRNEAKGSRLRAQGNQASEQRSWKAGPLSSCCSNFKLRNNFAQIKWSSRLHNEAASELPVFYCVSSGKLHSIIFSILSKAARNVYKIDCLSPKISPVFL